MLWPFMWPKGSILLQLSVLICVLLLVAGRVANLFLPLYYKKIGKLVYISVICRVVTVNVSSQLQCRIFLESPTQD